MTASNRHTIIFVSLISIRFCYSLISPRCVCASLPQHSALKSSRLQLGDEKFDGSKTHPENNIDRRKALRQGLFLPLAVTSIPMKANAGEVGAKITQAVTQSDFGIAVRRSVVRGAQVMDEIDGQWEQLSDRFGLGSERSKRPGRPQAKVIPPLKPLNGSLAKVLLLAANQAFLDAVGSSVSPSELQSQIDKVATKVKPSFERAGSPLGGDPYALELGEQFNYLSYVQFRAYLDFIVERKIDFRVFKSKFDRTLGLAMVEKFLGAPLPRTSTMPVDSTGRIIALQQAVGAIERLCQTLVDQGFVAQIDLTSPISQDVELVRDWADDLVDLTWSIPLDGPITLGAQILLQEQGYRLYPNYAKYAMQNILETFVPGQKIIIEDYYMDTDYNSDPEKFQVREVLLNIVLESL